MPSNGKKMIAERIGRDVKFTMVYYDLRVPKTTAGALPECL